MDRRSFFRKVGGTVGTLAVGVTLPTKAEEKKEEVKAPEPVKVPEKQPVQVTGRWGDSLLGPRVAFGGMTSGCVMFASGAVGTSYASGFLPSWPTMGSTEDEGDDEGDDE